MTTLKVWFKEKNARKIRDAMSVGELQKFTIGRTRPKNGKSVSVLYFEGGVEKLDLRSLHLDPGLYDRVSLTTFNLKAYPNAFYYASGVKIIVKDSWVSMLGFDIRSMVLAYREFKKGNLVPAEYLDSNYELALPVEIA